mmetsp:Transcript_17257/g.17193  ORF Transcript_17257/g.17193 Transcript_17257/m.17193 type:complete len:185 (-) Transcript_17257:67-621(-)
MLEDTLQDKPRKCIYKIGKVLCIGSHATKPFITIGPQWPYSVCLGIIIICLGCLFVGYLSLKTYFILNIIGAALVPFCLLLFIITVLKDPGVISKNKDMDEVMMKILSQDKHFCDKCWRIKDLKTVHCSECCVCVSNYDHHCIVMGKCIGGGNIRYFYAFVLTGMIGVFYLFTVIICLIINTTG